MTVELDINGTPKGSGGDSPIEEEKIRHKKSPLMEAWDAFLRTPTVANAQKLNQIFSIYYPYSDRNLISMGGAGKGRPPPAFASKTTYSALGRHLERHMAKIDSSISSGRGSTKELLARVGAVNYAASLLGQRPSTGFPAGFINEWATSARMRINHGQLEANANASAGGGDLSDALLSRMTGILTQIQRNTSSLRKLDRGGQEGSPPMESIGSIYGEYFHGAFERNVVNSHPFYREMGRFWKVHRKAMRTMRARQAAARASRWEEEKGSNGTAFKRRVTGGILGRIFRGGGEDDALADGAEGAAGSDIGMAALAAGGAALGGGLLAAGALFLGYPLANWGFKKSRPIYDYRSALADLYRATNIPVGAIDNPAMAAKFYRNGMTPSDVLSGLSGMGLRGVSPGIYTSSMIALNRAKYLGGVSPAAKYRLAQFYGAATFNRGSALYMGLSHFAGYLGAMKGMNVNVLASNMLPLMQAYMSEGVNVFGPNQGQFSTLESQGVAIRNKLGWMLPSAMTGSVFSNVASHVLGGVSSTPLSQSQTMTYYKYLTYFTGRKGVITSYPALEAHIDRMLKNAGASGAYIAHYNSFMRRYKKTALGKDFLGVMHSTPGAANLMAFAGAPIMAATSPYAAQILNQGIKRSLVGLSGPNSNALIQELEDSIIGTGNTASSAVTMAALTQLRHLPSYSGALNSVFGGPTGATAQQTTATMFYRDLTYSAVVANSFGNSIKGLNDQVIDLTLAFEKATHKILNLVRIFPDVTGGVAARVTHALQ